MIFKNKKIKSWLVATLLIVMIYGQNPPWPIWTSGFWLTAVGGFFLFILAVVRPCKLQGPKIYAVTVSITLLFYFFIVHGFIGQFRGSYLIFAITAYFAILLRSSDGALAFQWLTQTLAWLLAVSVAFYLLWLVGVNFPSSSLDSGDWKGDSGYIEYINYFLFVQDQNSIIPRFYSVFDEPGVLGTLASIILCGLRFDFRKPVTWIIFCAGLLTASVAFFLISFLGWLIFRKINFSKFGFLIVTLSTIGVFWNFQIGIFDVDDASLFEYILYRLFNLSQGVIDYRSSYNLDRVFEDYIFSMESIFGMGTYYFIDHPELLIGQTPKFFILEYGIFGLILLILPYVVIINLNRRVKKDAWLMLGLLCLSFLQRPQLFTPALLVLFAIICSYWSFELKDKLARE